MSAKLAEALTRVSELYNQLSEAYAELSALQDVEAAKSGKRGDDGDSGNVSGRKGKTKVAEEEVTPPAKAAGTKGKSKAKPVTEDDVREAAQKLIKAKGRQAALDVLGEFDAEKIADLEEDDYAKVKTALEAALAGYDDL